METGFKHVVLRQRRYRPIDQPVLTNNVWPRRCLEKRGFRRLVGGSKARNLWFLFTFRKYKVFVECEVAFAHVVAIGEQLRDTTNEKLVPFPRRKTTRRWLRQHVQTWANDRTLKQKKKEKRKN